MSDSKDSALQSANYPSKLHRKLDEFLEDGKYCDVNIRVGDRIFQCHRVVLASASKYFDSMFGGSFKEARLENFVLHEIDPTSFDTILKSLYQGRPPIVDAASVQALLRASNFLDLREIERCCVNFVLSNIQSIDEVLEIFSLARAQNNAVLVDALGEHIIEHLVSTVKKCTFVDLQYDDLNDLLNRYRSRSPFVPFPLENFLLDALIRWVYHSIPERKKSFEKLIKMVDFEKISVEYIEFFTEKYKVAGQVFEKPGNDRVLKRGQCLQEAVVNSIMLNNEFAGDIDALPILYADPPSLMKCPTLHVCMDLPDEWETTHTVYSMNNSKVKPEWFHSCSFTRRNRSPFLSSLCAHAALDEPNYLFCQEYNVGKSEMLFHAYSSVDLSSKPHVLRPFAFTCDFTKKDNVLRMSGANGRIYLYESSGKTMWSDKIGGLLPEFSRDEYERRVYHYNCGTDKWFPMPERKAKLNESYLISNDELVYMIGGRADSNNIDRAYYVQAYDYRMPCWLELPKLHRIHGDMSMIINNYLCGNSTHCSGCFLNRKLYLYYRNLLQVFDPVANRWEKIREYNIPELSYLHRRLKIVSYSNSLWTFDNYPDKIAEVYDVVSQEWRELGLLESLGLFNLRRKGYFSEYICKFDAFVF